MKSESFNHLLKQLLLIPILTLIVLVYYQIGDFDFLYNFDDDFLVLNSPELKEFSWLNIQHLFSSFKEGLYHPITSLSWMIELHYFGENPHAFHYTNLTFHLLNTILIFFLGKKLGGKIEIGLAAALLFGLHPLHVENISWISARKDLMVAFFFLLSLLSYTTYLLKEKKIYYALSFTFALLALFSKASAVVIPLILLLIDWLKGRQDWKGMLISKIPFFLLSIVFAYINYMAQAEYGYITNLSENYSALDRFFMLSFSAFYYLYSFLVPLDLAPKNLYPKTGEQALPIIYYLSLLGLAIIAAIVVKWRQSLKWVIFALLFYLFTIGPNLKLIPTGNDIVSNRYAYLALIGLYIAAAYYLQKLNRMPQIAILLVIAALWGRESYLYADNYKDSYSLWSKVIDSNQENQWGLAMAYNERGQIAYKDGKLALAQSDINRALTIEPQMKRALLNRANIYDKTGQLENALKDLDKVLVLEDSSTDALKIRSSIYGKLGKSDKALDDLNRAVSLDPNSPELFNNLGIVYSIKNEYPKALENFKKAVELSPYYLQARMNLGKLYIDLGENENALEQLAIVYDEDPELYYNAYLLGKTYFKMNEAEKAERILRKFANEQRQASQIANQLFRDSLVAESIPYFTIAIGEEDIRSKSLYQRAQAYKAVGQTQNAIDDLLGVVESVPKGPFFIELGMLSLELENKVDACDFFEEAKKRDQAEANQLIAKYCND